jgi:hypothetical protein
MSEANKATAERVTKCRSGSINAFYSPRRFSKCVEKRWTMMVNTVEVRRELDNRSQRFPVDHPIYQFAHAGKCNSQELAIGPSWLSLHSFFFFSSFVLLFFFPPSFAFVFLFPVLLSAANSNLMSWMNFSPPHPPSTVPTIALPSEPKTTLEGY